MPQTMDESKHQHVSVRAVCKGAVNVLCKRMALGCRHAVCWLPGDVNAPLIAGTPSTRRVNVGIDVHRRESSVAMGAPAVLDEIWFQSSPFFNLSRCTRKSAADIVPTCSGLSCFLDLYTASICPSSVCLSAISVAAEFFWDRFLAASAAFIPASVLIWRSMSPPSSDLVPTNFCGALSSLL